MKLPEIPANEKQRQKDLDSYNILDTPREPTFDQITSLAAALCGTKYALVTLVDADRQWFKACYGIDVNETPRSISFCAHAIQGDDIYVVKDTLKDICFHDSPLVTGPPNIRFYAGAPLITPEGNRLGTLCVLDSEPRDLSEQQKRILQSLARHVMDLFELKKKTVEVESFARIINQTTDAMMAVAPPTWKFNFANAATLKLFGVKSLEEFYQLGPWDVSPELQPDGEPSSVKAQRMIKQAMETGNAYFEWCHKRLDGSIFPCMIQLSKIEQGNQTWCLGSVRDVTNEKALERQLLEAQSIANIGSWTHNLVTNEVTWSKELVKIFEVDESKKQFQFHEYRDHVHPDDLPKLDYFINRAKNNGEDFTFDHRLVFEGGARIKYVQGIAKINKDSRGVAASLSGTLRDRTADVENEEKYRRLLEESQFVLDTLGIGVWKSDMVTGAQMWDKNVHQLWEVDPENFTGDYSGFSQYLTEEAKKRVEEDWDKILHGLDRFSNTYEIVTPKGKRKFIGTQGIVIRDNQGKPTFLFGVNWDRSKEVEMEKNLQFEKAKTLHTAKLASIGQLAAGVGHEINNPLAVISGHIAMAEQLLINGGDPKILMDKLHKMENSVNRITNIVKGLRTFARSDNDELSEFDPFELVRESVDLVSEIYQHEGVVVSLRKETLPVKMLGNRGRLQQVLVNLLSNARDATIGQNLRRIDVIVTSGNGQLKIIVKDNGHGVPEEIREKIFEPFFTTKDVSHGTGIGLSLVSTIIKEHNGKVDLRSEEGKGAEFEITLPVNFTEPLNTPAPVKKKTPVEKFDARVLVLDDEPELREVLKEILEISCVEVYSASSVPEAMKLLKERRIDAIISDIKMPAYDGFEFLAQIKRDPELKNTRFFFLTGGIEMTPAEKTIVNRDTDGVFYKPIKFNDIVMTLKQYFKVISP
ncbi:MAG: ATP-binding protein [Bacteriovoracaceae bacterium]